MIAERFDTRLFDCLDLSLQILPRDQVDDLNPVREQPEQEPEINPDALADDGGGALQALEIWGQTPNSCISEFGVCPQISMTAHPINSQSFFRRRRRLQPDRTFQKPV